MEITPAPLGYRTAELRRGCHVNFHETRDNLSFAITSVTSIAEDAGLRSHAAIAIAWVTDLLGPCVYRLALVSPPG